MIEILSMIGLVGGLLLLITLTIRGVNVMIAGPLSALFVAMMSGLALFPQLAEPGQADYVASYMTGFSGFIFSWFPIFILGAIFGKVMEDCGAADSISHWIVGKMGLKHAVFAIVAACAIMTYGGVSLFVVAFSVYPMALSLFKQANLPRRFIPAALAFGSVTFTMTSAGSPEIQNVIPIKFLGTTLYSGWQVSIVVALFMATFGFWWLRRMITKAVANGECYDERPNDPIIELNRELPNPFLSMLPLVMVLGVAFVFHDSLKQSALLIALTCGVLGTVILNWKKFKNLEGALSSGTAGALIAIGNTSAVVGFGTVAKASPAFTVVVDAMTSLPGHELIGAAVAVSVIAGLTGSASGGQSIALPALAPHYLDLGVDPDALHRVVAISSGALDSLPHNGYVVTTIRAICGEKHKDAYAPLAALTVIVPVLGVIIAIALFVFW
ncbi:MAG: GntP family permease [Emcibacter sp.]|nr:GntP family permease [Emcibacter sp.]